MKRYLILAVAGLLGTCSVMAQDYAVSNIPSALKEEAHSVVRNEEVTFTVSSPSQAVKTVKRAITVFNEKGYRYSYLIVPYDKFSKVKRIRAVLYDEDGKEIKKLDREDIADLSMSQGFGSYDDNRLKAASPEHQDYPFTFEYEYEVHHSGLLSYPFWSAYDATGQAVQNASFTFSIPSDMSFRYKLANDIREPVHISDKKDEIYTWKVENAPPIREEPYSVSFVETLPVVYLAPEQFEIDGFPAELHNWDDFGSWIAGLNEGRGELSDESKKKVHELTDGLTSDREKAKVLYEFMQDNTRYVSIQLGIGGWQPIPADEVASDGYGDCKGLTNYLKAMLEEAGIDSKYVLVRAGAEAPPVQKDFPSNQFNHAFLMVPEPNDTIWLECTSQTMPFGYNGSFTDDREVLLITEEGGTMIRTPRYQADENRVERRADIRISEDGTTQIDLSESHHGVAFERIHRYLQATDDDVRKDLYERSEVPGVKIKDYAFTQEKSRLPVGHCTMSLSSGTISKSIGDKKLILLNPLNRVNEVPAALSNRRSDVLLRRARIETDEYDIYLPQGWRPMNMPEDLKIESPFGTYERTVEVDENGVLHYTRMLQVNHGRFAPSEYESLRQFIQKLYDADNQKIVLTGES